MKAGGDGKGNVEKGAVLECLKEKCKSSGGSDKEACMKNSSDLVASLDDDDRKVTDDDHKIALGERRSRKSGPGISGDGDDGKLDAIAPVKASGGLGGQFLFAPNGTPPVPPSDPK
jgi:hypothetical protein